jgi:hypothetical protein
MRLARNADDDRAEMPDIVRAGRLAAEPMTFATHGAGHAEQLLRQGSKTG